MAVIEINHPLIQHKLTILREKKENRRKKMAVIEINHPLIQHKLTILRNCGTDTKAFRENLNEIAKRMTYEAWKGLNLNDVEVTSPLMTTTGYELQERLAIVPILRAGLGMMDGILDLVPTAKVGHVGVYRLL